MNVFKSKISSQLSLGLFLVSVVLLTSCATTIKEAERDANSTYRGFWRLDIAETPDISLVGNYRRNCWDVESVGNVQIAGGRVVARVKGYDLAGFVNANGEFTAELELRNRKKLRLRGALDAGTGTGKGKLVHNLEEDGLGGCTTNVSLKKSAF